MIYYIISQDNTQIVDCELQTGGNMQGVLLYKRDALLAIHEVLFVPCKVFSLKRFTTGAFVVP